MLERGFDTTKALAVNVPWAMGVMENRLSYACVPTVYSSQISRAGLELELTDHGGCIVIRSGMDTRSKLESQLGHPRAEETRHHGWAV